MGATGATGPTGATGATGATGPAGVVAATAPLAYDGGTQTVSVQANGITNAQIANRTRRVVISGGSFTGSGTGTGVANFSVATTRSQGAAPTLGNNATNVVTTVFTVPSDFLAGQTIPKITVYWATDEGGASRQVDCDVGFTHIANITSPSSAVAFRYNFRNASGASTNAMDSLNPAQGAIVAQTLPEGTETYDNTPTAWAPGDIIILSIGRNGASGSDPNSGNIYIYGIALDYTADM